MNATNEHMVSYGMGWQFGRHLLTHNFEGLDLEAAFAGVRDCFEGNESPYTDAQVEGAFKVIAAAVEAKRHQAAQEAAANSVQFMADNAQKDDVTVTPSGLQYRVIEMGEGKRPGQLDSVKVHYHGMLTNGDVFDSSVQRNEPAEFAVQEVIPGWVEALQMFPVGSKVRLFIPAELAYGQVGKPPVIPGNAALIFDMQVLDIV